MPIIISEVVIPATPRPKPKYDPEDPAFDRGLGHEYEKYSDYCWGTRVSVHFPHGGSSLLDVHYTALANLAQLIKMGSALEMYAICDRTGSQAVNYKVSAARLKSVQDALYNYGAAMALVYGPQNKAFGEDYAAERGLSDNAKAAQARAVVIYVWPNLPSSMIVFADRPLIQYGRTHKQPF